MGSVADYKLEDFQTFYNLINNELTTTTRTRHATNPSTNTPLPAVPVSTSEDVDRAVAAAQAAFPAWRDLTQNDRAAYLLRFADAIQANKEGFAKLLGEETGKPPQSAAVEVWLIEDHIRGTVVHRLTEEVIEDTDEKRFILRHVPLGVGAGIIPWNFPMTLGVVKLCSALLAGNTFIWKPSPYTPNTALKLGELGARIFPAGVLNVLSGEEDLGPWLTAHPGIAKISFTGSVATGKKVMQACAATLKRVTLELGGNDAAIVYPDVDLATVVPKIVFNALVNSGQVCIAIKRVYVHEQIYDAFLAAMMAFVQTMKVGPSDDPTTVLGPVQNSMHAIPADKLSFKPDATTKTDAGFFLPPTIIDNPPDDSQIVADEQFGLIVSLLKWSDEEDVLRRVNATLFGLGGSVWSKDVQRAEKMARRMEAGTVWVNTHLECGANGSYAGHKNSGIGAECGLLSIKEWCNLQGVYVRKD
ncbi:Aldehyde/histidinol dehydrogenase [Podospora appendiculata]|uniref:aldehyde dehydrogenase (NAD(+)) n=1 Tax=Podospora appendiculata TaxID=314037 RepID=A0AAE0X461_9PEZI|nr:Aldehyde/histidinol dehydrogenase [Podospora appendiculata]